jgi:glycerol-3-phosphate O-acyltransferase
VLLSYFRNNVLHLFACAAWVAVLLPQQPAHVARANVVRLGRAVYPFLQAGVVPAVGRRRFARRIDATIDIC